MSSKKLKATSLLVRVLIDSMDLIIVALIVAGVFGLRVLGGGFAFLLLALVLETFGRVYKRERPYFLILTAMSLCLVFLNQLQFLHKGDLKSVHSISQGWRSILILCGTVKPDSNAIDILFAATVAVLFYMPTVSLYAAGKAESEVEPGKHRRALARAFTQAWQLTLHLVIFAFMTTFLLRIFIGNEKVVSLFSPTTNMLTLGLLLLPIHYFYMAGLIRELRVERISEEESKHIGPISFAAISLILAIGSGLELILRGFIFFWPTSIAIFCSLSFMVWQAFSYGKVPAKSASPASRRGLYKITAGLYFSVCFLYFLFAITYSVLI